MKLRSSQRDALAAGAMDNARRQRLLELQRRGFDVEQDPIDGALVVRDAAGGFARVESLGLCTRVTSAEGRVTELEQYPGGRIKKIIDPSGREVRFERDADGFLQSIDRGPEGGAYRFELSRDWQPLRIDYPDGTGSRTQYSPTGQPTQVIHRDGTEIRYEYAPDGSLASLVDPKGHCTRLSDHGLGLSRVIDYANGDQHEYIDDPGARLLRFDVNGKAHALYQETGNDSFEVRYRDGGREHYVYSNGRIIEAVNEHSTVKFVYDDAGRLLSEDTNGQVVQYLRNEVGALVGIVTPEGETLSYTRDRDQRLIGITDWVGGCYGISLPPSGPPVELHYPNGVTVASTSNAMGLPATWTVKRATGSSRQLDHAAWEHDVCDRLIASTRDGQRREYQYDRASRIIAVQCADEAWNEHFQLDLSGNRVRSAGAPCEYDPMNRLLRQGEREFRYDGLGNCTEDRQGTLSTSYVYNGRNQLVAVNNAGRRIEYGYDALGRRIFKRIDGVTTRYQWAGTQLLSESVDDGQRVIRRDYLCCPEFLTPLAFRENSSIYYIHCGRLQEPLCVTDKVCEVVWKAEYAAFGRAYISIERVRQPWRLPGQYHDDETGLHYAVARYYDPDLGRFLSMDPLRVSGASLNYYTYCDGDPINRLDPTGEISLTLGTVLTAMAIGAVVGAVIGAGIELYKQRNQEQTDWGQVGRAGLIGGCLGAIGGAVGVVAEAALLGTLGVLGSGAAAGALGAAAEYCVEAAGKGEWKWDEFGTSVVAGAAIGAVTAGIGGMIAARAARRAAREAEEKAVREAAQAAAREAEEKAAREAAQAAAREAEEKAVKEAEEAATKAAKDKAREAARNKLKARREAFRQEEFDEAVKQAEAAGKLGELTSAERDFLNSNPRAKKLAYDPDTKSFKPDEARAALQAEAENSLPGPVQRDYVQGGTSSGGDIVDGAGKVWDVKKASAGSDMITEVAAPKPGGRPGENVLVDAADMTPAARAALRAEIAAKTKPGSAPILVTPNP